MTSLSKLAVNLTGRPHLITPGAAQEMMNQLAAADPRVLRSERSVTAYLRARLSGLTNGVRPHAFDEDGPLADPLPPGGEAYSPLWMNGHDEDLDWGMSLKDGIACLQVDTPLYSKGAEWCGDWFHGYDTLTQAVRDAMTDDRVRGLFISMDSPGGVVSGGLETLETTLRAANKPVWVHAEQACSAAYWISAQADRILAPRAGLTGSIGAVMVHVSTKAALDKAGFVVTPITFGDRKMAMAEFNQLDEEALNDLQAMVDECGRQFIDAVTQGRPSMTAEALMATRAKVYDAYHSEDERSGLALGFIDEIMSEEDAFGAFRDDLTSAVSAPAPAAKAAQSPSKTKGTDMERTKTTARASARATKRAALEAQLKALDDEEMAEEEELEEGNSDPDEDEPSDASAEGDDEEDGAPSASSDDDEPSAADEEEHKAARREAILAHADKKGMTALGAELAGSKTVTLAQAKRLIDAAARGDKLQARRDHGVRTLGTGRTDKQAKGAGLKEAAQKRNAARAARLGRR